MPAPGDNHTAVEDTSLFPPPPPPRLQQLLSSLCALLLRESTLEKELLVESNPALQLLATETVDWLEWEAEEERLRQWWLEKKAVDEAEADARKRAEEERQKQVQLQQQQQAAAAEAEAKAGKKHTTPHKKTTKKPTTPAVSTPSVSHSSATASAPSSTPASPPPSPALAQQLLSSHGPTFVSLLLTRALFQPDARSQENRSLLRQHADRRVAFTLLQLACRRHPANLRVLLNWMWQQHGQHTRKEIIQQILPADPQEDNGTEGDTASSLSSLPDLCEADEWNVDPFHSQRSQAGFVGLKNQAATCYQNSFLQLLFQQEEFMQQIMQIKGGEEKEEEGAEASLLTHLQSIFFYLSHSARKWYDPLAFVRAFKGGDGQPLNPFQQQDVLEFCNMLFDRLEGNLEQSNKKQGATTANSSPSSSTSNLLKHYFGGEFQNELICSEYVRDPSHKFVRPEPFYVMSLPIKDCPTLQQCLEQFVAGEMLEGPNAYHCALCAAKRSTQKRCVVRRWPRTVIFHLSRFEFDFESMKTRKLNDEVQFPMEIDLFPYTAEGIEKKEKGEEVHKTEATQKTMQPTTPLPPPVPHTLTPTDPMIYIPCHSCPRKAEHQCTECAANYCPQHEQEAHSAPAPTQEAAAPSLPPSPPSHLYRLAGVLVHSGHAEGGHYYSFARSRSSPTEWLEFNDTAITPFDPERLAAEAFGGSEDTQQKEDDMNTPQKGKRKGRRGRDEWQTGSMEKSRNAYLLWYERIEPEQTEQKEQSQNNHAHMANGTTNNSMQASPVDSLSAGVAQLSLSPTSTPSDPSAAAAFSSSPSSSYSSLASLPASSLPPHLRSLHRRLLCENMQQLLDEMLFEKSYHEALYKVARECIDWIPPEPRRLGGEVEDSAAQQSESEEKSELLLHPSFPGHRYLSDLSSELDPSSDLSVRFVQTLTLFLLETACRSKDCPRLEPWVMLLQHAYSRHVGCCQWLLDRLVRHPDHLASYLLEAPQPTTRTAIASLLEVAVKKIIRFELDDEFDEKKHIVLPALKPLRKREDAQAGLAAALAGEASSTAQLSSSTLPSSPSSSPSSLLSHPLVQSACVSASAAPVGLFKPSAKGTVAVSAKLLVLEGVGPGLQKQFNAVGVKTLQELMEMTEEQKERMMATPGSLRTPVQVEQWQEKASQAVQFILEASGANEYLAVKKRKEAERLASKCAHVHSKFVGPKLLPAFLRTCLDTLRLVITRGGEQEHTCPELSQMLTHLATCSPALLQVLVEQGAVQTCMDVISAPITLLAKAPHPGSEEQKQQLTEEEEAVAAVAAAEASHARKEERKKRKKERIEQQKRLAAIRAAGGIVEEEEEAVPLSSPSLVRPASLSSPSVDPAPSKPADHSGSDSDDGEETTDLEDLSFVEMVGLLEVLVRASTTRAGKPGEAVQPASHPPTLSPSDWNALRRPPFLTRLVLQISDAKVDPPSQLATHLSWESREFTDRLFHEIFTCIQQRDFFDFYAAIKILQQILMHTHDSLHAYRVEAAMPRLLQLTSENRIYYKSTQLCIQSTLHLIQHVPAVAVWAKEHQEQFKWMDGWLTKNRAMPKRSKDGSAPEGQSLFAVKGGKDQGVNEKWENNWDEQISSWGVGLGQSDQLSDPHKVYKKMMLRLKTMK